MVVDENLIELDYDGGTKEKVIHHMIDRAFMESKIADKSEFLSAITKREDEFSTAIGYLVAIPHGQHDTVKEAFVAFTRLKDSILWGDEEVQLVFMLGVPFKNRDTAHMKILASLSRNLMEESFRTSLLSVQSNEEAYELLQKIERGLQ